VRESETLTEDEVIEFIRAHIGSVYTLEVLLLMKREAAREWPVADLVHELRSSRTAVAEALTRLSRAGLVTEKSAGQFSFGPTSPAEEQIASEIEQLYSVRPISVVKAIMSAPDDKLRAFSDAFKIKE
jgi:hypothetical protein